MVNESEGVGVETMQMLIQVYFHGVRLQVRYLSLGTWHSLKAR